MAISTHASDADSLAIDPATADLLFRKARTVNRFTDEPVTDDHIQAAYELLRWGPTSMNTQPLRLVLVRSPEARARLAAHMSDRNRDKTIAAPLTLVVAADADFHEHMETLAPHMTGARDRFEADGIESRAAMARTSALIQTGYLVVALRAVGLHVGPMGGFDAAGVDKEFFAPGTTRESWRSLLVVNLGQPAAEGASYPRQARLEFDQATTVA